MQSLFLAKAQSSQRKVKGEKPPVLESCAQPEAYQIEVSGEPRPWISVWIGEGNLAPSRVLDGRFMQLTFVCAFARDNVLTSSPERFGLGRCNFCFSPRRKARKESQKRNTADPEGLRAARGLPSRSFQRTIRPRRMWLVIRKVKVNIS
jgi:hypothetical protein